MRINSLVCSYVIVLMATALPSFGQTSSVVTSRPNLAIVATSSAARGAGGGGFAVNGLNDGIVATNTGNFRGNNANRPARTMHWVQYEWKQPINTKEIAVYWWNFNGNIRLPESYHIKYWDGNNFVEVKNVSGLGLVNNQLNTTTFDEVKTTRLRLELDSADRASATLLEWL